MARKQKLLSKSTANLTVLQQEAKFKAEFLAADGLPELQKTPPNHLKGAAKQEYKRIVQSVGKLPLRNLDRAELENYCTWYGIYKDISIRIQKYAVMIPEAEKELERAERRLKTADQDSDKETLKKIMTELKRASSDLDNLEFKRDTEIKHLDKATKSLKGLASDLGLNVNSRMQMNMPKTDEDKPKSIKGVFG
ncbi:MAG: P27 family phage terminase small subunit [Liquorilactobacillus nagelii]|jgi:P27 family predicted phage terminase small subunit|uniref:P27 family phage terminase small subunit n=1 Tax=Liquorilactobacillus nagelii TaxID=82688 RepID=UPI00242F3F9A|nr:P27 family phage terminase small subunit [Liquorilactobacillus nagelii]MCI1634559.1 P27 family phage terminase small subunit [Liquorilactobacillus nagelii]